MLDEALNQAIIQRLKDAKSVVITSHVRPDGDAIGSLLGMGLALQENGKAVQMVLTDGVPSTFRHLPGSNQIVKRHSGTFDTVIVVDCSDMERVGGTLDGSIKPDLAIDHHITNLDFAVINLVIPDAVATSEILAKYLPEWGYPITPDVAAALLTGLVSDTLGFRTSNIKPDSLRLAAHLMEQGANLPELYQRALIDHTFEGLCYWGQGLSHLQREGRMVWTQLSLSDRERAGYPGNDDADLINILSAVDDADISMIFVEQKGGRVKISWRSRPGIDVSQIALQFGGGGHPAASGAELTGEMQNVQAMVLNASRAILKAEN
jgi:bifunctional oligoribonuclease and PAP phosphatase NrnA